MARLPIPPGRSLRGRLVLLLSVAILLAAGVEASLVYHMARIEADEIFDFQMREMARTLQGGAAPVGTAVQRQGHTDEDSLDLIIQVWNAEGECLFQSPAGAALPAAPTLGFSSATVRGVHYRLFSARTPTRNIRVAQDLEVRGEMAAAMALRATAPILLLAPLLLVAVWFAVRRSTRPILRVQAQVSDRAADDFSPLATVGLPAEVEPLVAEINLLFGRLGRAFAAQRDFVADAAHELRTPLAALRLQAQGIQRAGGAEARAQAIARLLEGVDRATRLVEQLLVLARQESPPELVEEPGTVDLAAAAALAIGDVLPFARLRRTDLGMEAGGGAEVPATMEPLRILLRNLLENAVKYTPEGGTVDLVIHTEGDRAVVTVSDSGPGIPPAERARVFERFCRLADQPEPGNGLGLAIVKAIAERHQGWVTLDHSSRLGGLEVSVSLPLVRGRKPAVWVP